MNNTIQLISLILINLMEGKIFYYLCHCLSNKKFSFSLKSSSPIIFYGVIMGILAYYVEGYIFRFVFLVLMMAILKVISKKKLSDVFLLFIMIYLGVIFIQAPALLLVRALNLEQVYTFLVVQSLVLLISLVVAFKTPLHKVFDIIQRQILLKLILFLLIIIVLVSLFYVNYEYSISYLLYFSIFILLAFVGLSLTLARISYYTNEIPLKLHDVKNLLMGVQITVHGTSDIQEIRKSLDQCLDLMRLNNKQFTIFQVNQEKENIIHFIQGKKESYSKDLVLISDINYEEPNEKISLTIIVYMIGVLLDNAIEYTLKHDVHKPIFVKVSVWEDAVKISVENFYQLKGIDEIEKMFRQGYSTKASDGRGFGLFNLFKLIEDYEGIITSCYEYKPEYKSDYLILTIDINSFTQVVPSRLIINNKKG